jgi:hypothetical protein
MRIASSLFSLILVTFVVYVAQGYYRWVAQSESPYEELGIELHSYMPAPIQAWGCGKLRARFEGKTIPPLGCQDRADPIKWRQA